MVDPSKIEFYLIFYHLFVRTDWRRRGTSWTSNDIFISRSILIMTLFRFTIHNVSLYTAKKKNFYSIKNWNESNRIRMGSCRNNRFVISVFRFKANFSGLLLFLKKKHDSLSISSNDESSSQRKTIFWNRIFNFFSFFSMLLKILFDRTKWNFRFFISIRYVNWIIFNSIWYHIRDGYRTD